MRELIDQLLFYASGVWRYKWIVVITVWLVSVSGWVYVSQMPDRFQSEARVYVDTTSILKPLLRGLAVDIDISRQIRLMTRVLLSRPNLEKVARMTDLDLQVKDSDEMDELVDELGSAISIAPVSRLEQNLYMISASNADPQLAKRVVQSLLTIFVESTLGETRKDSDSAQLFLDNQIAEYEKRLKSAEYRLKEFKGKNLGMMPGSTGGYYERLQAASEALQAAKLKSSETQNRRDDLQRQLDEADPEESLYEEFTQESSYDVRIASLEESLDLLLLRYTAKHPDVIVHKETLAALEALRDEEIEVLSGAGGFDDQDEGPVMQQMRITLGAAEANVASINARVVEYGKRIERLKNQVDRTLEIEQQFKSLNRDYSVTMKNYNSLLGRRETARLSEDAGQSAETVQFRIVDPPYVPSEPSAPNRSLLHVFSLIAGLAVGSAIALFLFLLRPTFDNRQVVREITGLPVLGNVSMIWTPAQKRRDKMELTGFAVVSLALVMVFSVVLILDGSDVGLIGQIGSLKERFL